MSELIEYQNKIYNLIHPELRDVSESDKFSDNKNVNSEARDSGFLRVISDMFSDIMYKQKQAINKFKYLYDYSNMNEESGDRFLIPSNLNEIPYDNELDRYYIYFRNNVKLDYSNLFDESWVLFDDYNMFGIDRIKLDVEKTDEENDYGFYYRIYIGSTAPLVRPYYVLVKPSILYFIGKNKDMNIHLLNSKRVNESLMFNYPRLMSNKGSLDNLRNVAKSLEAELSITSFTSITEYYYSLLNDEDKKLVTIYIYNDNTYYLLNGVLYGLRFEDYRIDYLSEVDSFVITDVANPFSIKSSDNKKFVTKDVDINGSLSSTFLDAVNFDYDSGINIRFRINYHNGNNENTSFFERVGETTNWFLNIEHMGDNFIYEYSSIEIKFDANNTRYLEVIVEPTFDTNVHNEIKDIYEIDNARILKGNFYYNYVKYSPISIGTKMVELEIKHEVNSSLSKVMFNLAEYNRTMISRFYPDYYEVLRFKEEYNGERSFF